MAKPKHTHKKLIIGLTGGIATGKTTILCLFKQFGAQTVCCDELAHRALRQNTHTYRQIIKLFSKKILDRNKKIDRKRLGEIIFKNKSKRKALEQIVHPFVFSKIFENISKARGILVIDIPLLFETGFQRYVDRTIVVWCNEREQVRRLIKRDNISRKQALARIKTQMPLARKKKMADWAIDTINLSKGILQANTIWKEIVRIIQNKQ